MGFLRKFFPLALIVAFLGAPLLPAHAEEDGFTAERAPAAAHKKKKKKAHGKKGAKKGKKSKKSKGHHAKRHKSHSSATHAPPVDHSGDHLAIPGDVPNEQKPDLPPPNTGEPGK